MTAYSFCLEKAGPILPVVPISWAMVRNREVIDVGSGFQSLDFSAITFAGPTPAIQPCFPPAGHRAEIANARQRIAELAPPHKPGLFDHRRHAVLNTSLLGADTSGTGTRSSSFGVSPNSWAPRVFVG